MAAAAYSTSSAFSAAENVSYMQDMFKIKLAVRVHEDRIDVSLFELAQHVYRGVAASPFSACVDLLCKLLFVCVFFCLVFSDPVSVIATCCHSATCCHPATCNYVVTLGRRHVRQALPRRGCSAVQAQ